MIRAQLSMIGAVGDRPREARHLLFGVVVVHGRAHEIGHPGRPGITSPASSTAPSPAVLAPMEAQPIPTTAGFMEV
jgi:hypothetical protein